MLTCRVSREMVKALNKDIKKYNNEVEFTYIEMEPAAYNIYVCSSYFQDSYTFYDYDKKRNVYKCISVTYPSLYYACDNYLTTGSLQRALMAGGCEYDAFIKEIAAMVEI